MGLVGYTDASGVFHEAVSDAISTDADNALGHGTDGGLYVSASGGNANVKYYETDAQAEADYAAGNIPNDTSVIIRGTKPASDPELHKSDIATLAQIAGGTTTDGKVASAEDVYELNNSIGDKSDKPIVLDIDLTTTSITYPYPDGLNNSNSALIISALYTKYNSWINPTYDLSSYNVEVMINNSLYAIRSINNELIKARIVFIKI